MDIDANIQQFQASIEQLHKAHDTELGTLCPSFHQAVEFIGRRWMGAIILTLMRGPQRFNEILAEVPGLSDRLLTERLRELEEKGLAERRVLPTSPVRVEYELTEAGHDLRAMFCAIQRWGHKWFDEAPPRP